MTVRELRNEVVNRLGRVYYNVVDSLWHWEKEGVITTEKKTTSYHRVIKNGEKILFMFALNAVGIKKPEIKRYFSGEKVGLFESELIQRLDALEEKVIPYIRRYVEKEKLARKKK